MEVCTLSDRFNHFQGGCFTQAVAWRQATHMSWARRQNQTPSVPPWGPNTHHKGPTPESLNEYDGVDDEVSHEPFPSCVSRTLVRLQMRSCVMRLGAQQHDKR